MADQVVYEFQKNATECVRASLSTYNGHQIVNLRVFYSSGDEWLPSRKGLAISVDKLGELETAVRKLRESLGNETRPS